MKRIVILSAITIFTAACSGLASPVVSNLEQAPYATGPVRDDTPGSLPALNAETFSPVLSVSEADTDSFTSDKSLAACEMFDMTRQTLSTLASGDQILCQVQQSFKAVGDTLSDAKDRPLNIYDGSFHVIALDFDSAYLCGANGTERCTIDAERPGPDRVKIRISRTNEMIHDLELFACKNNAQVTYLKQEFRGNKLNMTSLMDSLKPEGHTLQAKATLSGTLSAQNPGAFTDSKLVHLSFKRTEDSQNIWGDVDYLQNPGRASLSGVLGGSLRYQGAGANFVNQLYGVSALSDGTEAGLPFDLRRLSLGTGVVSLCAQGGQELVLNENCLPAAEQTSAAWKSRLVEAWDGETLLALSPEAQTDTTLLQSVSETPLPVRPVPVWEGWTAEESWDCSDEPEATLVMAALDVNLSDCASLSLPHEPLNCWQRVGAGAAVNQMPRAFSLSESSIDASNPSACANNDLFDTVNEGTLAKLSEDAQGFTMLDGELEYTGSKLAEGNFLMVSEPYTVATNSSCVLELITTVRGTSGLNFACLPSQTVVRAVDGDCRALVGSGDSCNLSYENSSCAITE